MKSKKRGKNISGVEVSNISKHGVWLYVNAREYFLPYRDFPWFKNARVVEIHDVKLLNKHHLYWKTLDVDLELESLEHLEQYPLRYAA